MILNRVCKPLLLTLFAAATSQVSAAEVGKATVIGRQVPDFVLPDSTGKQVAMSDFNEARLLAVVFLGVDCPISNAYLPALADLQKRYGEQGLQVVGVHSVLSATAESIAGHVKEFSVSFPVLVDVSQVVADLIGASRTPEVFLLDRRRIVRYRGRIDDRVGYKHQREEARRCDLEEAIKELLAGKTVSVKEAEPEGCLITRRGRVANKGEITFAKHVSRILQNRCAECHHPGTAAPFSLLTYEDAESRADTIREAVADRRMPPWIADPRHGKFSNDLRMPTEEIDTLLAWIDNGKAPGNEQDLPAPRTYAEGWLIGKPDMVFKMPEEYTVQASGAVAYKYFVTPTNFEQDMWVQASEARPGNRSVVHHIIAFMREKGSEKLQNLPHVGGFAPGEEPLVYPAGIGIRIPAGAEIVWQVHYTPTGKIEQDRSELGLIFCKEPPERAAKGGGAFNFLFNIPPGAESHEVVSSKRFSGDVELLSLMPHMHLRGKDFKYTARYPDGTSEVLLSVPNYDFNWQHRYRFAQPVSLPAGTTLECVAHFDNSADNPANPDPTKAVRWGDQTWEEMMIGWYGYIDAAKPGER